LISCFSGSLQWRVLSPLPLLSQTSLSWSGGIATALHFTLNAIVALFDCFCPSGMDILGQKPNQPVVAALTLRLSAFKVIDKKYPVEVGMECRWHNMG